METRRHGEVGSVCVCTCVWADGKSPTARKEMDQMVKGIAKKKKLATTGTLNIIERRSCEQRLCIKQQVNCLVACKSWLDNSASCN